MEALYDKTAFEISRIVTKNYSTSFYSAVCLLDKNIQDAIFSIYGFVRYADEIVDTFLSADRAELLDRFEQDYHEAYIKNLSMNPILHSFQLIVRKYEIPAHLIDAFIKSMRADLMQNKYHDEAAIKEYIYGSAEVVGLMCLKVFTQGDNMLYENLKDPAMKLGSAFQKINFLRDLKQDTEELDRYYFPEINRHDFNDKTKSMIIHNVEKELSEAYLGIKQLPQNARLGVYIAYIYYTKLLEKIKRTPARQLISKRIRISDFYKILLFTQSLLLNKTNLL